MAVFYFETFLVYIIFITGSLSQNWPCIFCILVQNWRRAHNYNTWKTKSVQFVFREMLPETEWISEYVIATDVQLASYFILTQWYPQALHLLSSSVEQCLTLSSPSVTWAKAAYDAGYTSK